MIVKIERTWDDHIVFYLGERENSFLPVENASEELLTEYMEFLREQMTLAKQCSK